MKIGFIGMGNMAKGIKEGFLGQGIQKEQLFYYDIHTIDCDIQSISTLKQFVSSVDVIVLAVKPNVVESVIKDIRGLIKNQIIVSIVAGYMFDDLTKLFKKNTKHITIMPSTPVGINQGVTLIEDQTSLSKDEFNTVYTLLNNMGSAIIVPTSQFMQASAISGCGPAFVYMMIEAMGDAGVLSGLPRDLSYQLAANTFIGAASLQQATNKHPGLLKDEVCSPGGMTIKGVKALEKNGLKNALIDAILACNEKS